MNCSLQDIQADIQRLTNQQKQLQEQHMYQQQNYVHMGHLPQYSTQQSFPQQFNQSECNNQEKNFKNLCNLNLFNDRCVCSSSTISQCTPHPTIIVSASKPTTVLPAQPTNSSISATASAGDSATKAHMGPTNTSTTNPCRWIISTAWDKDLE